MNITMIEPFTASAAAQAERQATAAKLVAVSTDARQKLKTAGPAGVHAGEFIMDLKGAHDISWEHAMKVVQSIETVGFFRLEGSRTLVSNEIAEPTVETAEVGVVEATLTPGRHDRGWTHPTEPLTTS